MNLPGKILGIVFFSFINKPSFTLLFDRHLQKEKRKLNSIILSNNMLSTDTQLYVCLQNIIPKDQFKSDLASPHHLKASSEGVEQQVLTFSL